LDHQGHQGHQEVSATLDRTARTIIDAGLKVHKALGPGLLESVYEHCVAYELVARGLTVRRQVPMAIVYEGVELDAGYRLDLLVNEQVIIEVKAVEALTLLHDAQVLTYLKLAKLRLGLLINFNVPLFKQGVRRLAL
jgi:GxxExxY protein